ncbi:MAG: hypothetical protein CO137_01850 [Candidatus Magasanikbacteria bacterium CG_4_9_14_3_um_filter_32_9]|uniref:Cytochrome C biogenesis protein transmembrane domain-containing protein n=1 Tax=Candidatus Magasanikbacteria bacterium CG_4_9_14_3_um_filter_32_9 TaxID=1974644 RepID=A0A2M7Z6W3_9BACT|nr:MAG: hypothetical protein CO137_01850 [Candidatus Magasanikbacteria bacterium CG_4_9_14_3_um_filter_32_9]
MKKRLFIALLSFGFIPVVAKAHCPLCTVGAGALAVGARYLGISTVIVGIFIGAFALALGYWISLIVKKQYVKYQKQIIIVLIFLFTVIPLIPLVKEYQSFNLFLFGDYGSLMNRTYMYDRFIIGAIIGAIIMYISPEISAWIKKQRDGKVMPYQGMAVTFGLLALVSLIIQFVL